jgi:hypothetical protein
VRNRSRSTSPPSAYVQSAVGPAGYPVAQPPRTNGFAIASLVLGIRWMYESARSLPWSSGIPRQPARAAICEISVLDRGPRTATITADTEVVLFRLDRRSLFNLLDREGEIGRKVLVELAKRYGAVSRNRRAE